MFTFCDVLHEAIYKKHKLESVQDGLETIFNRCSTVLQQNKVYLNFQTDFAINFNWFYVF